MLGRSVTAIQKAYWNSLCSQVGCIACRKDGYFNDYVSIHHIDGRTKKNAHWLVLPLCANHHQDNGLAIAVHPYKRRFEQKYGNQYHLMSDCVAILQKQGQKVPEQLLEIISLKVAA